ncbi:MAG: MATE family efflux transporter [Eubacterium sp.]
MLQQLYNTVDSIVVGNFLGSEALAAVGSSSSLIMLLISFSMGAAAGAGVIVSQFIGAQNKKKESMSPYILHWQLH